MKISTNYQNLCGIYKITCVNSRNIYIGSSKNIYERLHKHKCLLKHNKHENIILQNAINKHGLESFVCEVVEECRLLNLKDREQFYINILNPKYNITKSVVRNILNDESRLKISNTLKEKYKNGLSIKNNKIIYCFDLKGNFLNRFESIRKASKFYNISEDSIRKVISNKIERFRDFIFSENPHIKKILYKKYILMDYEKNLYIEYDKLEDAANLINKTRKNLELPLKKKSLYMKRYKIFTSSSIKLEELLETLEADNQQPSQTCVKRVWKVQRLGE